MTSPPATFDMVLTRDFDAPMARVWDAWRTPELVQRWWGPEAFSAPIANLDFREGGTSLVCMRAPKELGGKDIHNTWSYTRIEPQRRIEFVLRFSDLRGAPLAPSDIGLPPGIPREVPHVITFDALADGKTRVTVTERGYTTQQACEISKGGMSQCLDKMARALAG